VETAFKSIITKEILLSFILTSVGINTISYKTLLKEIGYQAGKRKKILDLLSFIVRANAEKF
jgi:hypothetical protein